MTWTKKAALTAGAIALAAVALCAAVASEGSNDCPPGCPKDAGPCDPCPSCPFC